jgi:repressor LexA
MTLGDRIRELRKNKGLTQTQLGKMIGVQCAAIKKYEYNEVNLPVSKLEKIADIFDVSTDYLLGKSDWRNEKERQAKFSEWDAKYNPGGNLAKETASFEKTLKLFVMPASAGTGEWLGEGSEYEYTYFDDTPSNADFAIRVRGDSMEPMYSDNDIVFVKANSMVEPGQIGIFCINGEGYLKQLQGNRLISLNPKYAPVQINDSDSFFCAGRVIGKTRQL